MSALTRHKPDAMNQTTSSDATASQAIRMYDLCGTNDRHFSPFCWRTRLSFAHKGVPLDIIPTPFTEVPNIDPGTPRTVPTIVVGDSLITDSWTIAQWLDAEYPDAPTLVGKGAQASLTRFVEQYTNTTIHLGVVSSVIADIHQHLAPVDQAYFRESREGRFKKPIEEVQAGREDRVSDFRRSLHPVRALVRDTPYLGGETPCYADYVVFGALQWARVVSDFRLIEADDEVSVWFNRVADLYDGLGNSVPHYY